MDADKRRCETRVQISAFICVHQRLFLFFRERQKTAKAELILLVVCRSSRWRFCQVDDRLLGKTSRVLQRWISANRCLQGVCRFGTVQNLGGFANKNVFQTECAKAQ